MAETIKDFLVSVGFSVDGASERKFTDAIRSATLQADLLARGLEGAAKAIAKAVADISAGFESIFYTAQRANTSVGNLRAMTYALSQLGTSAGSAQASLSNFGRRLATDPGAESLLKAIGVRTRDAAGRLRDTTKLFEEFGQATQRMPTYVALGYAQQLGVDEDTMRAMREQPELLARLRKEQAEYARSIGLNQDEAAEKGKAFMQSLRRLEMVVTLVSQKILSDLAPALQEFIDKIIEWVRQNPDAIRDGIVQIGTAAADFAKALLEITKAIAPVIVKIGEMAGAITGHGGLQGVLEAMAAFMVASWAVRLVAAISSVNTAWGLMLLRLGLPIAIGAVTLGHSFQTPEQAAADPGQAELQREGIDRRARVRDWLGEKWGSVKRAFGGGGAEASEGRGGAGIRRRAARAAEIDKTNYNFTGENADVLRQAAKELGTTPRDLATVISYESGFNSKKWGGKGGNYMGLIQFGPNERRDYGANDQQSFKEQMPAVVRYLKHRGFQPGMDLLQLYKTINGGNPRASSNASDGNGTIAQHVAKMVATHTARAERFLASGSKDQPDLAGAAKGLDKLMTEQDRAEAAKAEAARAEAAKATAALTQAQRDAVDKAKRDKWNEVYKATGDAAKADQAMRQVGQPDTRGPDPALPKPSASGAKPAAVAAARPPMEAPARRPTFVPAIDPKPLGTSNTTDNSRSVTLSQTNTFNVQGSEPRQVAELVMQGQKSVGRFGLDGIKAAVR